MLRDGCYIFVRRHKMKFCVHKKPYIVHCCDDKSILMHSVKGNSSVTHVTFFQFFYFHQATIKHLVVQSNKFKAYGDLGVQFYITT